MNQPPQEIPRIMIVDDTPQNLQFLEAMLRDRGYQVFALPGGEMALNAAARDQPDLILLDILMPGMDGYEVCTRLKADPVLKDIPVLFLSALHEPLDKVRAFQVGGVDYILKPFQLAEVEARVRTHLELRRQRLDLQASLQRLRDLEQLRDNLVHLVVHDLRSPLTAVSLTLEAVGDIVPAGDQGLSDMVRSAQTTIISVSEMIVQLLDISRFEAGQMPLNRSPDDLVALARSVLRSLNPIAHGRCQLLTPVENLPADYDANLIHRVLANLVGNALKFVWNDGAVKILLGQQDGQARVAVMDDGPGIPPESHQKIFEKFGQVDSKQARVGTGLGLHFCKLAVEAHGGQIGVISQVGLGSTFWFSLPLQSESS